VKWRECPSSRENHRNKMKVYCSLWTKFLSISLVKWWGEWMNPQNLMQQTSTIFFPQARHGISNWPKIFPHFPFQPLYNSLWNCFHFCCMKAMCVILLWFNFTLIYDAWPTWCKSKRITNKCNLSKHTLTNFEQFTRLRRPNCDLICSQFGNKLFISFFTKFNITIRDKGRENWNFPDDVRFHWWDITISGENEWKC
jgi:hypothetical protein